MKYNSTMTPRQKLIIHTVRTIVSLNREALEHNLAINEVRHFDGALSGYEPALDNRMNDLVEGVAWKYDDTRKYYSAMTDKQYKRMVSEIIKEANEYIEQMLVAYQYRYTLDNQEYEIVSHIHRDPFHAPVKLHKEGFICTFKAPPRDSQHSGYYGKAEYSTDALKRLVEKGVLCKDGDDYEVFSNAVTGEFFKLAKGV